MRALPVSAGCEACGTGSARRIPNQHHRQRWHQSRDGHARQRHDYPAAPLPRTADLRSRLRSLRRGPAAPLALARRLVQHLVVVVLVEAEVNANPVAEPEQELQFRVVVALDAMLHANRGPLQGAR